MINYSSFDEKRQYETLIKDVNEKYSARKAATEEMAGIFAALARTDPWGYERRAVAMANCCSLLVVSGDGERARVVHANSCKVRLCPWCAYKRSVRAYMENIAAVTYMQGKSKKEEKWLHIVLTVKNVPRALLPAEIDRISAGIQKLRKEKRVARVVRGGMKSIEITYNEKADTYHPHAHLLLNVTASYFGRDYMKQQEWREMWGEIMGLDYLPQVSVKRVDDMASAVAEVSKYITKTGDLLKIKHPAKRQEVVETIDSASYRRRLCTYFGVLREVRAELKLPPDVPSEVVGDEDFNELEAACDKRQYFFSWHLGGYNLVAVQ